MDLEHENSRTKDEEVVVAATDKKISVTDTEKADLKASSENEEENILLN